MAQWVWMAPLKKFISYQFISAWKGETFRKPSFIGMQKSHNVNIKTMYKKQNKIIINNKTKVVVGAYLSRKKKKKKNNLL